MEKATAQLRYLRVAPRKVRFVADLIRRLPVSEAEAELMLLPRKSSEHLLKLLRSALANARAGKMNAGKLFISEIRVDEGPKLKRMMPRAQGRGALIQKKMSHITLVLSEGGKTGRDFLIPAKPKKEKKEAPKRKKSGTPKVKHVEEEKKEIKQEKVGAKRFFRRKSV